jgi:outer membrane protein OmpA-like peptidoglycan-associated protein
MKPRHLLPAAALLAAAAGPAPAAMAQEGDSDQEVSEIDLDAFILDIEATILDLDGGTGTTVTEEEVTITLDADVFFDFDQHELRPDAIEELAGVVEQIQADGATELHIAGHTDSVGSDDYNQALSERRAASVEALLVDRVAGLQITAEGFGASQPVAPNETEDGEDYPEGRALNRRVEITYPQ